MSDNVVESDTFPDSYVLITGFNLPEIDITDRRLREVSDEAMRALVQSNDPPTIFQRNGSLLRVNITDSGDGRLEELTDKRLKSQLERSANFVKMRGRGSNLRLVPVDPPSNIVDDMLSTGPWSGIPDIKSVSCVPLLGENGEITIERGYDPATKYFYSPKNDLIIPEIPENPTREDVNNALDILYEPFRDFPFVGKPDLSNVIGALLTGILRSMINGPTPLFIIDKPSMGTGGSKICDCISTIIVGEISGNTTYVRGEDEMRKSIFSLLIGGNQVIFYDNVDSVVDSGSLAKTLTASRVSGRILGQSKSLDVENRSLWMLNGINVKVGADFARRCIWSRIDRKCPRPWQCGIKYAHEDLIGWCKQNRGMIISAALLMGKAWIKAGSPKPSKIPHIGGFESWWEVIGGIMESCGNDDFLSNLEQFYDSNDQDTVELEAFLSTWYTLWNDTPMLLATVHDHIWREIKNECGGDYLLKDVLPSRLSEALHKGRFTTVLGKTMSSLNDRIFSNGLKVQKSGLVHNATAWKVIQTKVQENQRDREGKNTPNPFVTKQEDFFHQNCEHTQNTLEGGEMDKRLDNDSTEEHWKTKRGLPIFLEISTYKPVTNPIGKACSVRGCMSRIVTMEGSNGFPLCPKCYDEWTKIEKRMVI